MERAGVLFLLLTGGEPLLYPGFRTLYAKLKRIKLKRMARPMRACAMRRTALTGRCAASACCASGELTCASARA